MHASSVSNMRRSRQGVYRGRVSGAQPVGVARVVVAVPQRGSGAHGVRGCGAGCVKKVRGRGPGGRVAAHGGFVAGGHGGGDGAAAGAGGRARVGGAVGVATRRRWTGAGVRGRVRRGRVRRRRGGARGGGCGPPGRRRRCI